MIAINTGLILIVGGLVLLLLGKQLARFASVAIAILGLVWYLMLPSEAIIEVQLMGLELMPLRVDYLSWIFGLIFHIAAVVSTLYALHVTDTKQHIAGLVYAGAAIVAALAGDLVTLFIAWELTAIASVVLVWASNNETSYHAGIRYLIIQVGSGVLLLSGVILHYCDNGSVLFTHFMDLIPGETTSFYDFPVSAQLIFIAFGNEVCLSAAAQLVTRRLPQSHHHRHGFPERFHDQTSSICLGAWLSWHRRINLDRLYDDAVPNRLRRNRKRSAPRTGL